MSSEGATRQERTRTSSGIEHTVYLLRGLAREARHWGQFSSLLKDAFEAKGCSVRVVCLDLPGAGQHNEVLAPATIDAYAEFVDRQIELLEPNPMVRGQRHHGLVHLVGMSLGGMVSLKLADLRPSGFDSVVVINTSARNVGSLVERMQTSAVLKMADIMRTRKIGKREQKVLQLVSNERSARESALYNWIKIHETRPVALWNFSLQLAAAARFDAPTHLNCPVLVLASQQDRLVHPNCSARLAELLQAQLISHPTAGHDLAIDAPDWLAQRLADWGVEIEIQRQNHQSVR